MIKQRAGKPCDTANSQAPSAEEFRACLAKHIAHWQQRARQARAQARVAMARDPVAEDTADALAPGGGHRFCG